MKTIAILAYGGMLSISTPRRRSASLGRTLSALIIVLASGLAGCGVLPTRPSPAVAKKEPHLVLRLSERKLYLKDDDVVPPTEGFLVAIGRTRYPTPKGSFQVNELVKDPDFLLFDFGNPHGRTRGKIPPGYNNPLGLRWIGFAYEHGWAIGFHGTAKTEVLGQAVSHGCVRMRNEDIVKVFDRIKLGTTVVVED